MKPKKESGKDKKTNREMAIVTYIFIVIFFVMMGYYGKFLLSDTDAILNNSYNKRQDLLAKRIVKGNIVSAEGNVLATTKTKDSGEETRYYPYGKMFAPVVGRVLHDKTGIEKMAGYTMLTTNVNPILGMINDVQGVKNSGNNVVTTLNVKLSEIAYNGLSGRKGAVVVMDPETGKIMTMVSTPTYNPNRVDEEWKQLRNSEDAVLINRATQGLYPPGSTFKLVTALTFLRSEEKYKSFQYTCKGQIGTGTDIIKCYNGKVHGTLNLTEAFARSCNTSFAKIGTKLLISLWKNVCSSLYFDQWIPLKSIEQKKASFALTTQDGVSMVQQTAIGQGDTLVTPLQNALLVSAVCNKGVLMTPYVLDRVEDTEGSVISQEEPVVAKRLVSEAEAKYLHKLMRATVTEGTATALNSSEYVAGGKTGSAEFQANSTASHSWFIGYAEKNGKKLVVSIIVEGAGTGSEYAVPIARKIFDAYW